MAEIHTLAVEALEVKGAADAAAVSDRAVSGQADGTELIAHEAQIPTWRLRDFRETPVGTPYRWQGQVYQLWQQHDASGQPAWTPDQAMSLWDICHTTDPAQAKPYTAPQGARGLWQAEECCVQGGQVWRNTFPDNAYGPQELPERWTDLGPVEEIQGGGV